MARKKAYEEKIVKLIFIKEGIYDLEEDLLITCPISIHGAGQTNTIIQGKGIVIEGTKEGKKRVNMKDMTMKGSSGDGLYADDGLSFLCKDMTFTQCESGVYAYNTKGRLINCVITQCGWSGIVCQNRALIEVEGDQTKVDGNVASGHRTCYGLKTLYTSSIIHLLFPLTKDSVSTNNLGGGNHGNSRYGTSVGTIQTVESF